MRYRLEKKSTWLKILIPFLLLSIFLMMDTPEELCWQGHVVISVLIFMFVFWFLRTIHYCLVAVLGITLVSIIGELELEEIAAGFSSTPMFFLASMLIIAYAVNKSGLGQNFAFYMIHLCKNSPKKIIFITPVTVLLSALFIPSAVARATILRSVYDEIYDSSEGSIKEKENFAKATSIAIGPLNPIASATFLSGSAAPLIAAEIISIFTGYHISWIRWFYTMGVPFLILFGITTLYLYFRYPLKDQANPMKVKMDKLVLSSQEKVLLCVLACMILLWVTGDHTGLPPIIPALLGAFLMFVPSIEILSINDIRKINWELLIFNGVVISFSYLLVETKAADWVSELIYLNLRYFSENSNMLIFLVAVMLVLLRTLFFNNATYLTTVLPIVFTLGPMLDLNSLHLAYITVFASSIIFLPMQSIAAMVSIEGKGFVTRDLIQFSTVVIISYIIIIPLAIRFIW